MPIYYEKMPFQLGNYKTITDQQHSCRFQEYHQKHLTRSLAQISRWIFFSNLGIGSIPTAFQLSITSCINCQPLKNTPPKIESRTSPDLISLQFHNAPHPSKEMMLDGFQTSQTNGAFPNPVIIHGYSSKAPSRFGCLPVRVDKRVTKQLCC